MDDTWLVLLQLLVVFTILASLLTYLLKGLVCRAQIEVGTKAVLITGCDTGIGNELAKILDFAGFHVFAGCLDTSSEGAQRLRVECSPFLKLVNMDVTRDDHVQHAVQYVRDNLPAGEMGRCFKYFRTAARFFLPLRETIEESAERRHLWQYWAKRGAARCPECNADSSIGFRGCKQIGLQGRIWGWYRTLFTDTNNYIILH